MSSLTEWRDESQDSKTEWRLKLLNCLEPIIFKRVRVRRSCADPLSAAWMALPIIFTMVLIFLTLNCWYDSKEYIHIEVNRVHLDFLYEFSTHEFDENLSRDFELKDDNVKSVYDPNHNNETLKVSERFLQEYSLGFSEYFDRNEGHMKICTKKIKRIFEENSIDRPRQWIVDHEICQVMPQVPDFRDWDFLPWQMITWSLLDMATYPFYIFYICFLVMVAFWSFWAVCSMDQAVPHKEYKQCQSVVKFLMALPIFGYLLLHGRDFFQYQMVNQS